MAKNQESDLLQTKCFLMGFVTNTLTKIFPIYEITNVTDLMIVKNKK